jgi:phage shock protein E
MRRLTAVAALALSACMGSQVPQPGAPPATKVGAEARALVAGGARLLDVRTSGEFGSGHLEGAWNIPVDQLEGQVAELEPKDRPIVVYCHSGARSAGATQLLRRAGFTKVLDLGAMRNW